MESPAMKTSPYQFVCRADKSDEVMHEIERQDIDFQASFYLFVQATSLYGWNERERLETLDGRFQTYALPVHGNDGRRAMLTREVGTDCYTYLGLTTRHSDRDVVFGEACQAHGLVAPSRQPHP